MREELIKHFKQQKANAEKTLEIYLKTAEEHDIKMDWVITEQDALSF